MAATFSDGRVLSGQELSRMAAAIAGTYVVPASAGGAVTASAGMTVAVAAITAGLVVVNGTRDTTGYAGGTTTISAADGTNPRRDYVWYDGAGAIGNTAGTPAAAPVLPDLTSGRIALAEIYVAANDTTISGASEIIDRRHNISQLIPIVKYKTSTQSRADTTFTTMTASSGNFDFPIAANEVWRVEYDIPMTFTGTGGAKWQLTGPAAPTAVSIRPYVPLDNNTAAGALVPEWEAETTAFSTPFGAHNAAAGTDHLYVTAANGGNMRIIAYIANGANAGTVTLQFAQNTANGTTVAGIGSMMTIMRLA